MEEKNSRYIFRSKGFAYGLDLGSDGTKGLKDDLKILSTFLCWFSVFYKNFTIIVNTLSYLSDII